MRQRARISQEKDSWVPVPRCAWIRLVRATWSWLGTGMPSEFPELKPQDELRNSAPSPPDTTGMPPGGTDTSMWGCSLPLSSEEPGVLVTSHSHPCSLRSFIYSFICLLLRAAYVPGIIPDLET